MKNIEGFDRCTAVIFSSLYSEFPVPIDLDYTKVPKEIFSEDDAHNDIIDKFVIYENTIIWLAEAGYVNAKKITDKAAYGLVLSAKGLEILKFPSSLEKSSPTFGESIANSVRAGAIDAAKLGAKSAITKGLSLAYKAIQNNYGG